MAEQEPNPEKQKQAALERLTRLGEVAIALGGLNQIQGGLRKVDIEEHALELQNLGIDVDALPSDSEKLMEHLNREVVSLRDDLISGGMSQEEITEYVHTWQAQHGKREA